MRKRAFKGERFLVSNTPDGDKPTEKFQRVIAINSKATLPTIIP